MEVREIEGVSRRGRGKWEYMEDIGEEEEWGSLLLLESLLNGTGSGREAMVITDSEDLLVAEDEGLDVILESACTKREKGQEERTTRQAKWTIEAMYMCPHCFGINRCNKCERCVTMF